MPRAEIAAILASLGCPSAKCDLMADQLDKRAQQLAAEKGRTHDEALRHLLRLMAGGWAAPDGTTAPTFADSSIERIRGEPSRPFT